MKNLILNEIRSVSGGGTCVCTTMGVSTSEDGHTASSCADAGKSMSCSYSEGGGAESKAGGESSEMSSGAIAGIVGGSVGGAILVSVAGYVIYKKCFK